MKFVFLSLLLLSISCSAGTFVGRVVRVQDGDTITVLDSDKQSHRIRLSGIDAPEKTQPFGQRSKQSLSDLVFGKQVAVESSKRDRYGREVGKVTFDGIDVNLEQVKRGMAWWYREYQREQSAEDRAAYEATEASAKNAKKGLWIDPEPTPPWEFRHRHNDRKERQ